MAEKISPSAKKLKLDVVQKPPPRRPNAFVAIPFDDSNIKSKIKQQNSRIETINNIKKKNQNLKFEHQNLENQRFSM